MGSEGGSRAKADENRRRDATITTVKRIARTNASSRLRTSITRVAVHVKQFLYLAVLSSLASHRGDAENMIVRTNRRWRMVNVALLVRLEAKPGKEAEVEDFLRKGLALVQAEPETTAWFAIRLGVSTFGIFDAFPDDAGRQAHLSGRVAAALKERAAELFSRPPVIETVDVLAAKLP
jgi:quinol monooxygenase YgiN